MCCFYFLCKDIKTLNNYNERQQEAETQAVYIDMLSERRSGYMEEMIKGQICVENTDNLNAGTCTEEPGDNCWLQLD